MKRLKRHEAPGCATSWVQVVADVHAVKHAKRPFLGDAFLPSPAALTASEVRRANQSPPSFPPPPPSY